MHLHRRIRAAGPPGPERQRGATLVLVAGFLVALVLTMALAIEVGRLYAAQQNVHRAANLAAIETARYVGGCRALPDGATLQSIAQQSVVRNYANRGDGDVPTVSALQTGVVKTGPSDRQFLDEPEQFGRPFAVALTVTDDSYNSLFPAFTGIGGPRIASAAASNRPEAAIGAGSRLVGINPTLLSDLLGINVGAAQQGDLADVEISIGDLVDVSAGVVTRQQVLDTSLNDALNNLADVVSNSTAGLVRNLADLFNDQTSLLDILEVVGPVGRDVSTNAGALVNAAAQLAAVQRDASVEIPLTISGLPPLVDSVTARLRFLEPPQQNAGPPGTRPDGKPYTEVRSPQAGIELNVDLSEVTVPLVLTADLGTLPLVVEGALTTATLDRIKCASLDETFHTVQIGAEGDTIRAGVGRLEDTDGDGDREFVPDTIDILEDVTILGLISVSDPLITVSGESSMLASASDPTFEVDDPEADLPATATVGGNLSTQQLLGGLLSNIDLELEVLGIPVPLESQIIGPLNDLLGDILAPALAPLLDPILEELGVSLGAGEVQLLDLNVNRPTVFCSERGSGCMP